MSQCSRMAGILRKAILPLVLFSVLAACQPGPVGQGPSVATGSSAKVALLVPEGSGDPRQDALARNLVQAARLAIDDLDNSDRIELLVFPTAGNPDQATAAVQDAAAQGAHIILGPLYSGTTEAAGKEAARHGLKLLSFSNNTTVAGGNVFLLGNTFENAADVLVEHAVKQGFTRIAVVAAQNTSGDLAIAAVSSAAHTRGATVASVATYERTANGVIDAMPSIKLSILESGAQAIILDADAAGALPIFAELLPESGPDPAEIQYIGLTRWDIPPATLRLSALQGGWFARTDRELYDYYVRNFVITYDEKPHPLAGLAYDGMTAIGTLLQTGGRAPFSASNLTRENGFSGVHGVFRLNSNGTVWRRPAVAEIQDGEVVHVDPVEIETVGTGV